MREQLLKLLLENPKEFKKLLEQVAKDVYKAREEEWKKIDKEQSRLYEEWEKASRKWAKDHEEDKRFYNAAGDFDDDAFEAAIELEDARIAKQLGFALVDGEPDLHPDEDEQWESWSKYIEVLEELGLEE